jgi:hypothetical protein
LVRAADATCPPIHRPAEPDPSPRDFASAQHLGDYLLDLPPDARRALVLIDCQLSPLADLPRRIAQHDL